MIYSKAFAFALLAVIILAFLAAPLAQRTGFERTGLDAILGRVIGFGFMGAALLLIIETPVLLALHWGLKRRIGAPRSLWALAGIVLAMLPIVLSNMPGESLFIKLRETLDASWSQPTVFASEWLPFLVGGAIFGWYLFPEEKPTESSSG
jgi:hypothetical protein